MCCNHLEASTSVGQILPVLMFTRVPVGARVGEVFYHFPSAHLHPLHDPCQNMPVTGFGIRDPMYPDSQMPQPPWNFWTRQVLHSTLRWIKGHVAKGPPQLCPWALRAEPLRLQHGRHSAAQMRELVELLRNTAGGWAMAELGSRMVQISYKT